MRKEIKKYARGKIPFYNINFNIIYYPCSPCICNAKYF